MPNSAVPDHVATPPVRGSAPAPGQYLTIPAIGRCIGKSTATAERMADAGAFGPLTPPGGAGWRQASVAELRKRFPSLDFSQAAIEAAKLTPVKRRVAESAAARVRETITFEQLFDEVARRVKHPGIPTSQIILVKNLVDALVAAGIVSWRMPEPAELQRVADAAAAKARQGMFTREQLGAAVTNALNERDEQWHLWHRSQLTRSLSPQGPFRRAL